MKVLSQYAIYILLLPLFFVLHGFTEYYDLVPVQPALALTVVYIAVSIGVTLLCRLLLRDFSRASLLGFCLMGYYFFFGAIQDVLKKNFPGTFLVKYIFLLPVSFAILLFIFIYLRKTKRTFLTLTLYLNLLFTLLVCLDAGWLISKMLKRHSIEVVKTEIFRDCTECAKPDIYLIVADGYPGRLQLKEVFGYDNATFENELKQRGFYIAGNSTANYNFTYFSMASTLNMNYLGKVSGSISDSKNPPLGSLALKNNQVLVFLKRQGYLFFNYSLFNFKKKPSPAIPTFLINDTRPITNQTLLSRLKKDLGYHVVTTLKIKLPGSRPVDLDLRNNLYLTRETIKTVRQKTQAPKFVYTHLVMPHNPYYFDSLGNKTEYTRLTHEYGFDKKAFISYLVYANKRYLELVDSIRSGSGRPPVIILMGDHGFRELTDSSQRKSEFRNLCAVLLPGKEYARFYPEMSNVNIFRLILNAQFRQQLPLLKDSTVYLKD